MTHHEASSDHTLVKCDVALRNASNGEDLITGTATLRLPKGQDIL